MARIRCHYADCVFLDQGYCAAAAVEIDPEEGCLTYSADGEVAPDEAWEENELLEEEWAEAGFADLDEDEIWLEEDVEEEIELELDDEEFEED